jgi:hypothetical protein
MDLREVGWEDVDWIHLAQERFPDSFDLFYLLRGCESSGNLSGNDLLVKQQI